MIRDSSNTVPALHTVTVTRLEPVAECKNALFGLPRPQHNRIPDGASSTAHTSSRRPNRNRHCACRALAPLTRGEPGIGTDRCCRDTCMAVQKQPYIARAQPTAVILACIHTRCYHDPVPLFPPAASVLIGLSNAGNTDGPQRMR